MSSLRVDRSLIYSVGVLVSMALSCSEEQLVSPGADAGLGGAPVADGPSLADGTPDADGVPSADALADAGPPGDARGSLADEGVGSDGRETTDGSSLDSSGDDAPAVKGDVASGGATCGTATLVGRSDHSGTIVTLDPGDIRAVTNGGGRFCFDPPSGTYEMSLSNGEFADLVHEVIVIPGSLLYSLRDELKALPPLIVPRARPLAPCRLGRLSPDGTKLLSHCSADAGFAGGSIQLVPLAGGQPQILADRPRATGLDTDWTTVVFYDTADTKLALWSVPLAGGMPVFLTSDLEQDAYKKTVIRSAAGLVFYGPIGGTDSTKLLAIKLSGGGATTLAGRDVSAFDVSLNGARVVYRNGSGQLTVVNADGSAAIDFTNRATAYLVTSDFSKIVWESAGGLFVASTIDGSPTVLVPSGSSATLVSLALSDTEAVFTMPMNPADPLNSPLVAKIVRLSGDVPSLLGGTLAPGEPIAPDGKHIFLLTGGGGAIVSLENGSAVTVAGPIGFGGLWNRWSKDSSRIVSQTAQDTVAITVATGAVQHIAGGGVVAVSPDGAAVAYTVQRGNVVYNRVMSASGDIDEFADSGAALFLDSKHLELGRWPAGLYLVSRP